MRRVLVASLLSVLLVACGGRQGLPVSPPPQDEAPVFELPDPIPAAPAWVASLAMPATTARLKRASKTPGVAVLAPVSVKRLTVRGPSGSVALRVASVDPLPFRSLAPESTRDAEFVWTALLSDRAVITTDAAKKLGVTGADQLGIGSTTTQVGAFADNGVPNIADVLISPQVARQMGLGRPRLLIVGAKSTKKIDSLGRALKKRLPGAKLRRIRSGSRPAASSAPEATGSATGTAIGTMQFRILQNGFIDPDPSWVAANISTATVPILGSVHCHRIVIPQLGAALQEVVDAGLSDAIRPDDYGGCYVPRFIDRDPRRGLSMHAFGLAVDLNVSTNGLGTRGDIEPAIVEIFQKWGFAWGGAWARPDPMHFELARIVQ